MEKKYEKVKFEKHSLFEEVLIALRRIIQSIDLHSRYLVRQFGLTGPQLMVLQQVSNLGEISIGEIGRAISLGQATVTGILERLETRGLIIRERSESDKRKVIIKTTPSADQLLEKAPPPLQEHFLDGFANLRDWEQSMLLSSLQRIVALMDAKSIEAAPILADPGPIDGEKETIPQMPEN